MGYIRLQSKKYDITADSRSFEWGFSDIYEAMYEDVSNKHEFDSSIFGEYEEELWSKLMRLECDTDEFNSVLTELWECLFDNYERGIMVLNGVSCYDAEDMNKAAKKLYEYFEDRDEDSLTNDENYVLVFEGKHIGEGHNGEDVVRFTKEIKRVETKEFFNKYLIIDEED